MSRELRSCIFIFLFTLLGITTSAWAYVYVVKENDSLSVIAKKHIPGPVWGNSGSLRKIIAQNPEIKNPNLIFPGDEIQIEPEKNELVQEALPASVIEDSKLKDTPTNEMNRKITGLDDDKSSTELELAPFYANTALTSKDPVTGAESTVASNFYAGVDAKYLQLWNDSFKSYLRFKLSYVSFKAPTDGRSALSNGTSFLTAYGIGGVTKISSRISLDLHADYEQDLFVRSLSSTSVTVDSVLVPSLGAKLSYEALKLNAFTLGISSVYELKFTANTDGYSIRQGALFGGIIDVKQHRGGEDQFQVELGAFMRNQDKSSSQQTESFYSLSIRFYFPLSEKEIQNESP